jgi:flagellar biogenesis protein FliO
MAKEIPAKQSPVQQSPVQQSIARQITVLEVMKSIVAIPVVIAIVLGIAWGLVRVASWQQERSGKPDPVAQGMKSEG